MRRILSEQTREKALVIFGAGHVWHGEGGITRALQQVPDATSTRSRHAFVATASRLDWMVHSMALGPLI